MMTTLADVLGAFSLTVFEKKTETMSLPIPHTPVTPIAFTTTRQQFRQTTSFVYLKGMITESSRLSAEIDRRTRAGWMSFNRYRAELYDRPTASLDQKAWMVKSEVVEALLYGCGVDPAQGRLPEAPRRTPQDVASDPLCLVQVAGPPDPLLPSRPSTDGL